MRTHYFDFFKELSHGSFKEYFCVQVEHDSHSLDFWVNFDLSDFDCIEQPIEKTGLVDVGVEDKLISCVLEKPVSVISGAQVPSPKGSSEVESGVLLQTHERLSFQFHVGLDLLCDRGKSKLFEDGPKDILLCLFHFDGYHGE